MCNNCLSHFAINWALLYKHQRNTKGAFARKHDIFTSEKKHVIFTGENITVAMATMATML